MRAQLGLVARTAAREAWNYLGISLDRRLGMVVQWGKAAGPGGWVESPGGVGAMAADAVAGKTELAEFGILGPLEVSRCGRAVPLGGPRQRAVLALLLLEANRVVSLDRLAEDVWGGHPPEGWVTTVQIYVSHLRQALEPDRARGAAGEVLVTRNRGYLLRVDGEQLDAARFQDGFTAGRAALEAGRYAEAAGTLRRRWACGAAGCWPTWPTTRSPGRRRPGWRSCGWPRSRPGSTRTWRWAGTTR